VSARMSAGRVRSAYAFIRANRDLYSVHTLCRVLEVAPSGYYKWLQRPVRPAGQNGFAFQRAAFPPDSQFFAPGKALRYKGTTDATMSTL